MQSTGDTIAAVATPPGRGGVGIVRISGGAVADIANGLLGALPPPRVASYREFRDGLGRTIDRGLALYFPAPNSFTGEPVLELHGHGGPVVLDMLLARALELGARLARAGEFSERAFLNDKLDLAQAEAVADLIDAASEQGARAALRSLAGEFSDSVHALVDDMTDLRMYVEAAIDFPEEEIDFLADGVVERRARELLQRFDTVTALARSGRALRDGLTVVIAGPPNAGKSSLLNRLAGHAAAIVTEIPGTTRDLLRELVLIDGMPLHVVDTAGLHDSGDAIEAEGMRRAQEEITRADRVLLVVEAGQEAQQLPGLLERFAGRALTVLHNKIDLAGTAATRADAEDGTGIWLSAKSGDGLDLLRAHLRECAGLAEAPGGAFSARTRHLDALRRAREHAVQGLQALHERHAGELLAEELRLAQQALGEITGAVTSDELLGHIFSRFCIGK